jgi:hypothetical protein
MQTSVNPVEYTNPLATENIDRQELCPWIDARIGQISRDDLGVWLLQQMCNHVLSDITVRTRDQEFGFRHSYLRFFTSMPQL